jgi:hypothetical protein
MGLVATPMLRVPEEVDRELARLIDGEWTPAASGRVPIADGAVRV